MAAAKAADAVYHVDPPPTAKKLRELLYSGFYFTDHTTHFYALGGPDFVMGPDAPVAERNILGVIHKVGLEIGGKVIQARKYGHRIVEMIGGRKVHPCTSIPGGLTKGITEEQRAGDREHGPLGGRVRPVQPEAFNDIVLGNKAYVDLILGDIYTHQTYYIGMVDANNKVNFYDGKVSVVAPDGERDRQVRAQRVHRLDRRARRAVDLSEVPLPEEGRLEGLRGRQGLGRLHGHPALAPERRRRHGHPAGPGGIRAFYATLGGKPRRHHRLATHWARLIELLYAAERWVELADRPGDHLATTSMRLPDRQRRPKAWASSKRRAAP